MTQFAEDYFFIKKKSFMCTFSHAYFTQLYALSWNYKRSKNIF